MRIAISFLYFCLHCVVGLPSKTSEKTFPSFRAVVFCGILIFSIVTILANNHTSGCTIKSTFSPYSATQWKGSHLADLPESQDFWMPHRIHLACLHQPNQFDFKRACRTLSGISSLIQFNGEALSIIFIFLSFASLAFLGQQILYRMANL